VHSGRKARAPSTAAAPDVGGAPPGVFFSLQVFGLVRGEASHRNAPVSSAESISGRRAFAGRLGGPWKSVPFPLAQSFCANGAISAGRAVLLMMRGQIKNAAPFAFRGESPTRPAGARLEPTPDLAPGRPSERSQDCPPTGGGSAR
jgi:hypothetical protein